MRFNNFTLAGLLALSSLSQLVVARENYSGNRNSNLAVRDGLHLTEQQVENSPAMMVKRAQKPKTTKRIVKTTAAGRTPAATTTKAVTRTTPAARTSTAIRTTKTTTGVKTRTTARNSIKTSSSTRSRTTTTTKTSTRTSTTTGTSTATQSAFPTANLEANLAPPVSPSDPQGVVCKVNEITDPKNPEACVPCKGNTVPNYRKEECVPKPPCPDGQVLTARRKCEACKAGTELSTDGDKCVPIQKLTIV